MDKIKDIPKKPVNLIEAIRKAVFTDLPATVALRLAVAKNIFIILAVIYYGTYLATVWGLLWSEGTTIIFAVLPAFLLSVFALLFFLIDYGLAIYAESVRGFRYLALALCIILFASTTAIQFGLIHL